MEEGKKQTMTWAYKKKKINKTKIVQKKNLEV